MHIQPVQPPVQPQMQNMQKVYEDLYLQVIQERDPKEALNRQVMRDKQSFEYYKEGLPQINQWID